MLQQEADAEARARWGRDGVAFRSRTDGDCVVGEMTQAWDCSMKFVTHGRGQTYEEAFAAVGDST